MADDRDALMRALLGRYTFPGLSYRSALSEILQEPQPINRNAMNAGPLTPANAMNSAAASLGFTGPNPIDDQGRQLGTLMGAVRFPMQMGKYGSLPEEAGFRKLMGQEYERAKATGDLSTQYDILGARLYHDRAMPQAMREAMELERTRVAQQMGPDGRKAAGIAEPIIEESR